MTIRSGTGCAVALRRRWDTPRFDDFDDVLAGFAGEHDRLVYSRPVGIAVGSDGPLLVSDDLNGAIYRGAYAGNR